MDEDAMESPGPEELLRHAEFVHGLARALTADSATADDLSQQAMAVALASPPRHAGNLRAWFSRLLKNLARTRARAEARRAVREIRAGRRRAVPAAADIVVEIQPLAVAAALGVKIDPKALAARRKRLESLLSDGDGVVMPRHPSGFRTDSSVTAGALFLRTFLDPSTARDDLAQASTKYLLEHLPDSKRPDVPTWYYGSVKK